MLFFFPSLSLIHSHHIYSLSSTSQHITTHHITSGGAGDSTAISYLTEALKNSGTNDVVQHGACLGVGLAAMATGDEVRICSTFILSHSHLIPLYLSIYHFKCLATLKSSPVKPIIISFPP